MNIQTKSGVVLPLSHSTVFDFQAVSVDQIIEGIDKDKQKIRFKIIAKTNSFLICINLNNNVEAAFDSQGQHLALFNKYKLTTPSRNKYSYPLYYVVNEQNEIVKHFSSCTEMGSFIDREKGVKGFNSSHPANYNLLSVVAAANNLDQSFIEGYILI